LSVYRDAVAAGRRPLYVCYNRPLADYIALIVPPGGEVATYHQLADRVCRARGEAPDFGAPGAFARLEAALDGYTPDAAGLVDELIVDEGQDFQAGWAENLLRFLKPPSAFASKLAPTASDSFASKLAPAASDSFASKLAPTKPGGRAWWLEDPMQNLYGRASVPLPGWVSIRSDINYRSPKDILTPRTFSTR
ncbi:MAG: hypothetical protein MUP61_00330, partial [Burkholderiales bacterium]|nr:hypothetical protein [Burkholderiales bacterium]